MNISTRVAFVVFCLFAAIACYVVSYPTGIAIFIVLGMIFEMMFWKGIFGKKKRTKSDK